MNDTNKKQERGGKEKLSEQTERAFWIKDINQDVGVKYQTDQLPSKSLIKVVKINGYPALLNVPKETT